MLPNSNGSFSENTTTNEAILYYENPTGNVSALMLRSYEGGKSWFDVSSQSSQFLPGDFLNSAQSLFSNTLYESARNYTFSTPFTARNIPKREIDNSVTEALFYSPRDDHILSNSYEIGTDSWGTGFSTILPEYIEDPVRPSLNQNNIAIRQSDIAMFGNTSYIWIDGTQPVSGLYHPTPNNSFPFSRLASVYSADQSSTFLYHQMNDTTFAEEHWDSSSGA